MNRLKRWRIERGLSQLELAQASGVTRWAIQLIESTIKCPSVEECEALAAALGVRTDELFNHPREGSLNGN